MSVYTFNGPSGVEEVYTDGEPCAWCHGDNVVCYVSDEPMCFDCSVDYAADMAEQDMEDAMEDDFIGYW